MKNIIDELTGYRVKVERNGKEVVNIPGILCLPGLLVAPKMSIIGMVAAPFLGCNIHLAAEEGKEVDLGETVKKAAETVADKASAAAKTVKEEIEKAWQDLSAEDEPEAENEPETEDAPAEENAEETAEEPKEAEDVHTVRVNPDDSTKA